MLPRETVLRALKTPYKRVLDFAFTYVSLSKPEETCIRCVIIDGMTEEEAAEALGYSRDYADAANQTIRKRRTRI